MRNYERKIKTEFPNIPSEALDLFDKMLTLDPNQRIKASDALEHRWLHEIHTKGGLTGININLTLPKDYDCHEMWSKERKKKKRQGILPPFRPEPLSREANMHNTSFDAKLGSLNVNSSLNSSSNNETNSFTSNLLNSSHSFRPFTAEDTNSSKMKRSQSMRERSSKPILQAKDLPIHTEKDRGRSRERAAPTLQGANAIKVAHPAQIKPAAAAPSPAPPKLPIPPPKVQAQKPNVDYSGLKTPERWEKIYKSNPNMSVPAFVAMNGLDSKILDSKRSNFKAMCKMNLTLSQFLGAKNISHVYEFFCTEKN